MNDEARGDVSRFGRYSTMLGSLMKTSYLRSSALVAASLFVCAAACQTGSTSSERNSGRSDTGMTVTEERDASSSTQPDAQAFADASAVRDASTSTTDSGSTSMDASVSKDAEPTSTDSGVLFGERPSSPLSVPTFMALNSDESPRSQTDLLGQPTVLWFFPFAGTPG